MEIRQMELSKRLKAIADFVPAGARIADVGTDHGHLPIYLVFQGMVTGAVAMDIRKGPLSRAQEAVAAYGMGSQIKTRLSDGLKELQPGEADTVIIAGMGGALICTIMAEAERFWQQMEHWVISPQSEQEMVRRWLEQNGFAIARECMVLDEGKFYVVMDVVRETDPDLQANVLDYIEYRYGKYLLDRKDSVLESFLREERTRLEEVERCLVQADSSRAMERLTQVRKELNGNKRAMEVLTKDR